MKYLYQADLDFLSRNWPRAQVDAALVAEVEAWAEKQAAGCPHIVIVAVARLGVRYAVETDPGERACLLFGVQSLTEAWRGVAA